MVGTASANRSLYTSKIGVNQNYQSKWPSNTIASKNEFNSRRFMSMSASNSSQMLLARSILADSPLNPRTTISLNSIDSSRLVLEQNDLSFLEANAASTSFSMA